jgi:formylglycine-generating enzyme required for sulfatase activity
MGDRGNQITIFGDGNIVGDHSSADVRRGDAAPPLLDLDSAKAEAARERYRQALRERYNVIETHAFTALAPDDQVGSPKRPPLLGEGGVYVPLTFDTPRLEIDPQFHEFSDDMQVRTAWEFDRGPLPEVLKLFPGHLVIIGDAGSGKTTALHFIVSALTADDPETAFGARFEVLGGQRPLPIFLPLRLFEHACAGGYAPDTYNHCVADLLHFMDDWFARWCPAADLPPGFLADHVLSGRAWLLLDALDEVADPRHREAVRNVIHDLADQLQDTRLIVTARVAAYRDTRLDDRFAVVSVRDLDEGQRTQMVHAIYRGLALDNPDRYAADLNDRFRGSRALQDLTRTPVMVWTAAVIHALRGRLPEGRAALYDAYVDILLKKSFERARDDAASLEELVGGQDFSLQDRRHYLTYAAFQVHRLLETRPERHPGEEDQVILVGEDELVDEVLAPYLQDKMYLSDWREARQNARRFVALMVERSGLLYETTQGYTIGDHLTMQEFLAGCYLGDGYQMDDAEGYAAFLGEKMDRSWWREVFLLAAGYLAEEKGFKAPKFLEEIARQGESPGEHLTALALAGRGLLQLQAFAQPPSWYKGLAQQFANRLYQMLYAEPVAAPVEVRQEAGLVLGRLYGYPGEGGLRDPRFAGPQGLPAFVEIEEGWFWMGGDDSSEKDENPRHRVYLDGYEIARYPTTNAMFDRFIKDGGYGDERWWTEAIQDGYWKDGKVKDYWTEDWHSQPRYWDDSKWDNPSQPVVGVNWYEAMAYCRWLTATLDDGHIYRLPTEAEWERVARGSQGVRYPWGDDWREDHCNSEEAGLGVTSPVGIFPQGAAEGDIEDLVGNVYEWCRDRYGEDYYAHSQDERNPSGPDQGDSRVLRGGSWYSEGPSRCRCGCRGRGFPGGGGYGGGFRCVRTSSS